ncbi:hypothetical protein SMIDD26_01592 [Streptococcus mitis]|uniref:Uncharacterized protein n=1 Tax=Streptococcus mitis TaxID=28037 RepID=A0A139PML2_STRMT|nr:hypothetical protein SMIDD26_01592 [Streptococcus mitis]
MHLLNYSKRENLILLFKPRQRPSATSKQYFELTSQLLFNFY